jgi:hypothetical protein
MFYLTVVYFLGIEKFIQKKQKHVEIKINVIFFFPFYFQF